MFSSEWLDKYSSNFCLCLVLYFCILTSICDSIAIYSIYLDTPIIIDTLPGDISPENSYLEIKESAKAGDEIDIDINVFDLYGNKVDLKPEENKIFDLYHRYMENSKYTKFEVIEDEPEIPEDKKNIIRYNKTVTKGGFNEFRGIHKKTSTI